MSMTHGETEQQELLYNLNNLNAAINGEKTTKSTTVPKCAIEKETRWKVSAYSLQETNTLSECGFSPPPGTTPLYYQLVGN
jgi:hypothetical protein